LIIYFYKVLGGVGTFLQKGSDKTDGESGYNSSLKFLVKGRVGAVRKDEVEYCMIK